MSNLISAINIQIDSETKKQASAILNDLGLSMSSAINIFLRQVIKRDGLLFEIVNSKKSSENVEFMKEIEDMIKNSNKIPSLY